MGRPAGPCVAVAPGGPRSSDRPVLRPRRGAVRFGRSAGAAGRASVVPGSGSYVCPCEGGL